MGDWQALIAGGAAVITAVGTIIIGLQTGRTSRAKDKEEAEIRFKAAEFERERAEQLASTQRIEAIAQDAANVRKQLREAEDEFSRRLAATRRDSQRGWDLASYHFNMVGFLAHLLNNIFMSVNPEVQVDPQRVVDIVRNAQRRMAAQKIPTSLEEPIPERGQGAKPQEA